MGWRITIKEGRYEQPRSVSELAKCPRRFAREYRYMTSADLEKIAATASLGSLVHHALEIELERDGVKYSCQKEVEAVRRYGLAARVDYLCRHGDETVVVEVKTARREFVDEHVRQVRIYMLMLGANKGLVAYATRAPKPVVLDIVEVNTPMSEDELFELMKKHASIEPIPGSYCVLCPVKDCEHNPQRARKLYEFIQNRQDVIDDRARRDADISSTDTGRAEDQKEAVLVWRRLLLAWHRLFRTVPPPSVALRALRLSVRRVYKDGDVWRISVIDGAAEAAVELSLERGYARCSSCGRKDCHHIYKALEEVVGLVGDKMDAYLGLR